MQVGVQSVEYKRNSAHSLYFNSETGLRRVFVSMSKDGSPSGIKPLRRGFSMLAE